MIAHGRKGSLEIEGKRVIIRTTGTFGRRRPDQIIPISKVQQVYFKDSAPLFGYIYLDTTSGSEIPFMAAADRRNGLTFPPEAQGEFEAVRDEINRQMDQG